uniref:Uncharacterized protein n=1 Tax=Lepeophtheirus salmonis TaxID=72036 RepID=A0A0K2V6H2_LEPSM
MNLIAYTIVSRTHKMIPCVFYKHTRCLLGFSSEL